MNRGFVLGVDGGGTKTHLALATSDGCLRAMVAGKGTNLESQKPAVIIGILSGLLARACKMAGVERCAVRASCFAMSGVDIHEDIPYARKIITSGLGLSGPIKIHNDAFIALFNDGWRDSGAVVTVGTGHKWLAVGRKREFMHDGLVFPGLHDLALEELLKVAEGYTEPSAFSRRMFRRFGFSSPEDFIRRWRYGGSREYVKPISAPALKRLIRIKEFVGSDAQSGDPVARSLVTRYAGFLAEGVQVAVRQAGESGRGLTVVMSGSVLAGIISLRSAFIRRLTALIPGAVAGPARFRPIRGALVYAAHQAWGDMPPDALTEKVLRY